MSTTPPTHAELGIEIGKAQAMAEASGRSIQRVEDTLNDRMDRFEIKVDAGFKEIKDLVGGLHRDIISLKVQEGHEQGAKKERKDGHSNWIAILAIVVSLLAALSNFLGLGVHTPPIK